MLLLLILMVLKQFLLMFKVYFSLRTNLFLVIILKVILKILICSNLCNSISDKFILVDELSPKALQNLKTCVLINIALCGKLLPSSALPIKFHENLKLPQYHFLILTLFY